MTLSTIPLSPASSSSSSSSSFSSEESVQRWILVAVFIFLFFISYYLSKFIIAFLNGFSNRVSVTLIETAKKELHGPLSHALRVAFLTLAYVFLPVADRALWYMQILFYILRLYQWVVIMYSCVNVSRLIVTLVDYLLETKGAQQYVREGVVEFLYLVRFIVLVIVLLVLISFFPPNGSTDVIVAIFLSVNMVTGTLVVMVAPLMRSLVAGLSILVEQQIKAGEVISMPGICKVGRVKSFSLQQAEIESFEDGSTVCVPAIVFSRNAVAKCNATFATVRARFPLPFDMPVTEVRSLMETATSRIHVAAWLDEDFNAVFEMDHVPLDSFDATRTELVLNAMRMFQELGVRLRG